MERASRKVASNSICEGHFRESNCLGTCQCSNMPRRAALGAQYLDHYHICCAASPVDLIETRHSGPGNVSWVGLAGVSGGALATQATCRLGLGLMQACPWRAYCLKSPCATRWQLRFDAADSASDPCIHAADRIR